MPYYFVTMPCWILKAEKCYWFYNAAEEEKVHVALMCLEGNSLDLFALINQENSERY